MEENVVIAFADGRWAVRALAWLRGRDPGLVALRRAGRAAVLMPAMFALGDKAVGNPVVATFAAFGSFALLILVDFSGPIADRLRSQMTLIAAGAALICIATFASQATWSAALVMGLVGFCVLFAGVVSSVLAAATLSLLLTVILPISIPAPDSQIPDRLAGWGLAGAASLLAITVLWPAPTTDRLRSAATGACRALGALLRANVEHLLDDRDQLITEHDVAVEQAKTATASLATTFLATPYRPTGLSTAARAIVRLVDEIAWLSALLLHAPPHPSGSPPNRPACRVKLAAAVVLERGADLLDRPQERPEALRAALDELALALASVEGAYAVRDEADLVSALDPGFRAQQLAFVVSQIAGNVDLAASADRRRWHQRLLGRPPAGQPGALSAARRRALAHLEPHSVWLHNSLRGATGLALAVLVATLTGVQHSFWVILGTVSVLRSNALNTGQTVFRALLGTTAGVAIGAAALALIGTDATLLWVLLPLAVLGAGFAPTAISFAAGQAAFTVTIVILFNIVQPTGWHVGLIRIEDVALGFAISLVVGLLFWPRGAVTALRRELSEAYSDSARYLGAAVEFGLARSDPQTQTAPEPTLEADRAAASARRLDDAFRTYLAERARKPAGLREVTGLVNGVVALRLSADAVLDLWQRDSGQARVDHPTARRELGAITTSVVGWYEALATALRDGSLIPDALGPDSERTDRLVAAVHRGLHNRDDEENEKGERIIWTGDHLDAARRLQAILVEPARTLADRASRQAEATA